MKFKGQFRIKHYDKLHKLKGEYVIKNGVVNVGLDRILDVMFHDVGASYPWYIGLIDNSGGSLNPADEMDSHAWTEFTNYTEAVRQTWNEAAALGKEIVTVTPAVFTIHTGGGVVRGLFIVNDNTKDGTSGLLWSTALFNAVLTLAEFDTIKAEYELAVS